jgi:hypothetical protein
MTAHTNFTRIGTGARVRDVASAGHDLCPDRARAFEEWKADRQG